MAGGTHVGQAGAEPRGGTVRVVFGSHFGVCLTFKEGLKGRIAVLEDITS